MKHWKSQIFFDADTDAGGGGAVDLMGSIETPNGTADPGTEPQAPAAPATPAPGGFNAKEFAQEFGSELRNLFPQQPGQPQQPQQAPLTPEEAKKLLNFFEIDDGFLKEFGNIDTQKSALEKMRDGITRHIVTIMQARNDEILQKVNSRYEPYVQSFERAEGERRQERFNTGYPQLAAPQLQPILHAVAQSFRAEGKTFNDEKSMFDAIAKGVEAVIQQSNPAFKLTAAQVAAGATKTNNAPASAIPVTTPGSGGGGGQGPAAASTGPKAIGLLPKVR